MTRSVPSLGTRFALQPGERRRCVLRKRLAAAASSRERRLRTASGHTAVPAAFQWYAGKKRGADLNRSGYLVYPCGRKEPPGCRFFRREPGSYPGARDSASETVRTTPLRPDSPGQVYGYEVAPRTKNKLPGGVSTPTSIKSGASVTIPLPPWRHSKLNSSSNVLRSGEKCTAGSGFCSWTHRDG
jgi:hypothetical protein